jgi:electron transport complex protein RnfG
MERINSSEINPMVRFRDGLLGPTVILLGICLVIAFALSFVNQMTADVIAEGQIDAENEVRAKVLPAAQTFTKVTAVQLPAGVIEAYKADNGEGFVFRSSAKGFSGEVVFIVGIDRDGKITGIDMFQHDETPGMGTKVANESFLRAWYGDANPSEVDGITGATKTTNALRNALLQAKAAFELVKEE